MPDNSIDQADVNSLRNLVNDLQRRISELEQRPIEIDAVADMSDDMRDLAAQTPNRLVIADVDGKVTTSDGLRFDAANNEVNLGDVDLDAPANDNSLNIGSSHVSTPGEDSILYFETVASDIGYPYILMQSMPKEARSVVGHPVITSSTTTNLFNFVTAAGLPAISSLVAGNYLIHAHLCRVNDGGTARTVTAYAEFYSRTAGGTETLRGTSDSFALPDSGGWDYTIGYDFTVALPDVTLNITDRLVIKFYAVTTDGTGDTSIIISAGGASDSRIEIGIGTAIAQQGPANTTLKTFSPTESSHFTGIRGRGTRTDPTGVKKDDILQEVIGRGYDAPGNLAGPSVSIRLVADEDHARAADSEKYFWPTASDIGAPYTLMQPTPKPVISTMDSPTISTSPSTTTLFVFATDVDEPGLTTLGAGNYNVHAHLYYSVGAGTARTLRVYCDLYKRAAGGAETLLQASILSEAIPVSVSPDVTLAYDFTIDIITAIPLLVTDRLVIKFRGATNPGGNADGVVTLSVGGAADSRFTIWEFTPANGAHGTRVEIHTTPNQSDDLTLALTIRSDGRLGVEEGKDYLIGGKQVVPVQTYAAAAKTTPADADEIPGLNSAGTWELIKFTWGNIKATLKTYFDGIYQAAGAYLTSVTADAPLSGSGTAGSHLAIPSANSVTDGYMPKESFAQLAGLSSLSTLYLDTTASLADNFTLSTAPSVYAETANAKSTTSALTFFERFVSAPVNRTSIPAGIWEFNIFGATSLDVGSNLIKFRVNKRVIQTGMTGAFTGAGTTRTFTVTGGAPFVAGDANASQLLAGLIETPTQTAWISTFTSSSVVTVTLTDPAFVNVSGVALNAIYYYLFDASTSELAGATPALYTVVSVQTAFTVSQTDRIVIAFFCLNDTGTHTITLYYGGSVSFTHFHTTFSLGGTSVIADVPSDNVYYGRRNAAWTNLKTYFDGIYQAAGAYLTSVTADAPLSGSGTAGSHLVMADASAGAAGSMSAAHFTLVDKITDVITAGKKLTLTLTNDSGLTFAGAGGVLTVPVGGGTAAMLQAANVFTAAQTITATSDAALSAEYITDIKNRDFSAAADWAGTNWLIPLLVVAQANDITVAATGKTFTRTAGSFIADGFQVGMSVTWSGFAKVGTANNGTFVITTLTALVMTCSADTLTDEVPADYIACSATSPVFSHATAGANAATLANAKLTAAPANGDYFQITITAVTNTLNTLTVSIGGVAMATVIGKVAGTLTAYVFNIAATGGGVLTVTPGATWLGWIDNISVKKITLSSVILTGKMLAGTTVLEMRMPNSTSFGIGLDALKSSVQVSCTAVGVRALYQNTGAYCNAVGYAALYQNTGANCNAVGHNALYQNTGAYCNAVGHNALYQNTGAYCNAVGHYALQQNTGAYCNAVGYTALQQNTGASCNAFGYAALYQNTGLYCNAVGYAALQRNTGASCNAFGYAALYQNTGAYCNAFGYNAGRHIADGATARTGTTSLFLGNETRALGLAQNNQIVIGDAAIGAGANSVTLGNTLITTTILRAKVGVGTTLLGAGVTYQNLSVLGSQLFVGADSTQESPMFQIVPSYVSNTHASYTAKASFSVWDSGGARLGLEIQASGTAAMIGFLGATPIVRATELTDELTTVTFSAPGTPDYAIQDLAAGGYGFVTADEGQTALSVIANLQTRVNELETKLTAYGLLVDAD